MSDTLMEVEKLSPFNSLYEDTLTRERYISYYDYSEDCTKVFPLADVPETARAIFGIEC